MVQVATPTQAFVIPLWTHEVSEGFCLGHWKKIWKVVYRMRIPQLQHKQNLTTFELGCPCPREGTFKATQMKQLSLKDKVALVTGGARGIGRAVVEAFADRGAQIIVADIDEERAAGLAAQIGQQSFSVRLDAGAIDTIEGAVHEARAGGIDILVNNAAIFDMAPLLDVTPQSFERLFQVNVQGVFFVCKPSRG
jgi:Zn-dependent alcohol dehydrogenase